MLTYFFIKLYIIGIEWSDIVDKKLVGIVSVFIFLVVLSVGFIFSSNKLEEAPTKSLTATVMNVDGANVTVQDENHVIYTFNDINNVLTDAMAGDIVEIEYDGKLNKNKALQKTAVLSYEAVEVSTSSDKVPSSWQDNGIFSDFYSFAKEKLDKMTLDEKIAQLLLVRYPDNAVSALREYQFGGYVFFEKDFKNKTKAGVKKMINDLQNVAKIPILTATDEEGGTVVRVSSNPNLASEKFKSSKELYDKGGFTAIKEDTVQKSTLLYSLGLNVNLAPVVDVSTNPDDYMYNRTLGANTETTATYAKTVINASKGHGVSYTLKHFPGYGNNDDTHGGAVTDNRPYDDIVKNDLPPFEAGIEAGAEAVLVSHNTVINIDSSNPASLSPDVHNLLRNKLGFTGVIITDDLAMGATSSIANATVKAILAGNDLIITTDYKQSISDIKSALADNTIDENLIDKLAFRVLAWKYYKGLLYENQK